MRISDHFYAEQVLVWAEIDQYIEVSPCLRNGSGQGAVMGHGRVLHATREASRSPFVDVFTRSAYDVHASQETYTATQLNLAELTKEPSAMYQMCLWSQKGINVNSPG